MLITIKEDACRPPTVMWYQATYRCYRQAIQTPYGIIREQKGKDGGPGSFLALLNPLSLDQK